MVNVKPALRALALITGLSSALVVSAQQPGVSLYGGVFRPGQPVGLEYYTNGEAGRVRFALAKVLDPAAVFVALPDPHRPSLPAGLRTAPIRQFERAARTSYGQLELGRLPVGVYAVTARLGNRATGTLVVVSDLGLVVKRSANAALTYTADRVSGQTRPARVWRLERGVQTSAVADRDGLARFALSGSGDPVFLARSGESWAISDSSWNSYATPAVKGYVYTDRPVYRPGQRVEFKGTMRAAVGLAPLAGRAVRVAVRDPDGEEVYRTRLTTNRFGSFSSGFTLGREPGIGGYEVAASLEGSPTGHEPEEQTGSFEVQAYVKPEYAVTVTAARARAVQGDRVKLTVSAAYLFGGAVSGARVSYSVTKAPYYEPYDDGDGGDELYGADEADSGQDYGSDLVIQEEARLDQNGRLEVTLPLERDKGGQPLSYRLEAEVEDESRRVVSGSARVLAFPSAVRLTARASQYVYSPGEAVAVSLSTVSLDDKPLAAPVTLELVRQSYARGPGGYSLQERVLETRRVRTGPDGRASASFRPARGDGYAIRARAGDASGRVARDEAFVWVLAPGESLYWNYRDLEVRLDKRQYRVGETATALIGSPRPGAPLLVTIEAGTVRRAEVVRASGAAVRYSFKVTGDMSPNVFLTATVLGGGNLYSQSARVRVPALDQLLTLKVTPGKARYAPGEKGTMQVSVRDAAGRGVPAEVGLSVVDEAIYLVRPDTTQDIRATFFGGRDNAVGTDSSLDFSFASGPVLARAAQTEGAPRFADEKSEASDEVRQDFRDTILWVPHLVTDAGGQASVEVRFPDNLTTWRATARGQTGGGKAGQSTASTLTTKDLIARLSLPPFLVRGDTATVSAVVNNTGARPVSGTVGLALAGLTPLSALERPLAVGAGGRSRTDLKVRADAAGEATVTASARGGTVSDALRLPPPVLPRGYRATSGWAAGAADAPRPFSVPADARLSSARLKLYLTPSLTAAVAPALEYLVGYPYGCTEQTMSRFLPALLAKASLGQNALPNSVLVRLPEYIEVGLARLERFQHEDGGWGFWENDDSTLEMTAYVLSGLVRAKALGRTVKASVLENAVRWLRANANDPEATQAERAYAHRALAEAARPDLPGMEALARRRELTPYSLAQLAIGLSKAGRPAPARDLLDRLKAARIERDRGVHWEKPRQDYDWYFYWDDNDIQVTAVALEALARLEPASPLVPQVSAWLLTQRRGPRWVSTQDTAAVIVAALALNEPAPQGTPQASAKLNGTALTAPAAGTSEFTLPGLKAGRNTLEVRAPGSPRLVYAAELTYVREPEQLGGEKAGLTVTRRFEKLEPAWDKKNGRYTFTRRSLLVGGRLRPVTVGDLVLVTLEVTPSGGDPVRYLAVSDPLPAGAVAVDESRLSIAGLQDPDSEDYDYGGWNYWYAGRELRDDRVDLYASYLKGRGVMRYVVRAQTPGTFTALPTRAFLMYDPEVEGRAPAATLTVRDRGQ